MVCDGVVSVVGVVSEECVAGSTVVLSAAACDSGVPTVDCVVVVVSAVAAPVSPTQAGAV